MSYRHFLGLLLSLPSIAFAVNDFVGTYRCMGTDPYLNRKYSGTVTVKQFNTVYSLDMVYDTGEKYVGTGGQYDPSLMSVVFQDVKDLKRVGLEQYSLSADKGVMQGYWVYLGKDKLGTEVCKRTNGAI